MAAAVVLSLGTGSARALEIEQVVWGFDGQVVLHRFNPLSVLVSNPTPEPFDGRLELRRTLGAGTRIGAVQVEPLYVAPFARRWVQFYPYPMNLAEEWELSWGRRSGERIDVPQPRAGQPAWVALASPADPQRTAADLKRLRDDLFPPTVAATDGLAVVALGHVPRWESARRQALLDWLHAGGTLHLFQENGRYPLFTEELALLNSPLERQRIGAGTVYRHDRGLQGVDRAFLQDAVTQTVAAEPNGIVEDRPGNEPETGAHDEAAAPAQAAAIAAGYGDEMDQGFFTTLKGMTRPAHSWGLIHLLSLVYLALVFPGCWLLGRGRADYRVTLATIAVLVAAFSAAFAWVGRRGYGETTTVNSVAIARPLADGGFDVTGWTNAFVTDGDVYALAHEGAGRLYSTCQIYERVKGEIDNGLGGVFRVDIPPFSSRTFGYRVKARRNPVPLRVEEWKAGDGLEALTVSFEEPSLGRAVLIEALYRDRFYHMAPMGREFRLAGAATPVEQFLQLNQYGQFRYGVYYDPWSGNDPPAPEQLFQDMRTALIARSLGVAQPSEAAAFSLPDDRVRLFVYAPMPEEFFVQNPAFGRQTGYVLYCFDLFPPDAG